MTNPAFESIVRELAEREGLHELAKLYPAQGYVVPRRSRGWRVSRYREEEGHNVARKMSGHDQGQAEK